MGWFFRTFYSTIGKKLIMSLTGLFLCSFLLVHLTGNFQLFKDDGGEAFNHYSEFMSTNILIRILEIGLFLGFALHMTEAFWLYFLNKRARPVAYAKNQASENSTLISRTMIWSGSIVLVFLLVHLKSFFFDHRIIGSELTMYQGVVQAFQDPLYSWFYVLAMVLLGFHLNHGFQSAFQTLGLNHKKYTPLIKTVGLLFSILVPLGYITMPLYFLFTK
ncbi:MAG: succinate dehydrogenase cytochrome b subunit [Ignavibacteriales bacterium]|nr:succinate dehydrogenase cytochrome b subunit [Ignavibacteriales bacterium]